MEGGIEVLQLYRYVVRCGIGSYGTLYRVQYVVPLCSYLIILYEINRNMGMYSTYLRDNGTLYRLYCTVTTVHVQCLINRAVHFRRAHRTS